jgi:hypothetical protein
LPLNKNHHVIPYLSGSDETSDAARNERGRLALPEEIDMAEKGYWHGCWRHGCNEYIVARTWVETQVAVDNWLNTPGSIDVIVRMSEGEYTKEDFGKILVKELNLSNIAINQLKAENTKTSKDVLANVRAVDLDVNYIRWVSEYFVESNWWKQNKKHVTAEIRKVRKVKKVMDT